MDTTLHNLQLFQPEANLSDNDAFCHYLLQEAKLCARRYGLKDDAADDYAIEFLEQMLSKSSHALRRAQEGGYAETWILRCAENCAISYLRRQARLRRKEIPSPERTDEAETRQEWEPMAREASPEACLLRDELTKRILEALSELTPDEQEIFLCYVWLSEPLKKIAASIKRTPQAVKQSLSMTRKRLRAILLRRGLTEAELREYLIPQRMGGQI